MEIFQIIVNIFHIVVDIFQFIFVILVIGLVLNLSIIGAKPNIFGYIRFAIVIIATITLIYYLFPYQRGYKHKRMQQFIANTYHPVENKVNYKDVMDSNEIEEFSKNDKLVKTTKMERRAHGIDAYFYLVAPETPISAKFYCDKILAERQEFLVKQGRSIACDILGRNSPAEFLTVVYTYGGEEASYTYTNKWCVSFIDE